jgi:hypothetical protein
MLAGPEQGRGMGPEQGPEQGQRKGPEMGQGMGPEQGPRPLDLEAAPPVRELRSERSRSQRSRSSRQYEDEGAGLHSRANTSIVGGGMPGARGELVHKPE